MKRSLADAAEPRAERDLCGGRLDVTHLHAGHAVLGEGGGQIVSHCWTSSCLLKRCNLLSGPIRDRVFVTGELNQTPLTLWDGGGVKGTRELSCQCGQLSMDRSELFCYLSRLAPMDQVIHKLRQPRRKIFFFKLSKHEILLSRMGFNGQLGEERKSQLISGF